MVNYLKIPLEEKYAYTAILSKNNLYTSLIGLDILNKEGKKNEFARNV